MWHRCSKLDVINCKAAALIINYGLSLRQHVLMKAETIIPLLLFLNELSSVLTSAFLVILSMMPHIEKGQVRILSEYLCFTKLLQI